MSDPIKRDDALEPCPFCRSPAKTQQVTEDLWEVWCFECTALMQGFSTEAEAIAAWNTRALPAIDPAATREAALQARIEELEAYIENAGQAMSETSPNWEARCHAIMTALNMDFGGYSEDLPEVGSWFEVTNRKNLARIEELVKERDELGRKLNTARYGQPDFAWSIHEEAMADLRAKLTECEARLGKAMEALQWIKDHRGECFIPEPWDDMANNVLAELEGKE